MRVSKAFWVSTLLSLLTTINRPFLKPFRLQLSQSVRILGPWTCQGASHSSWGAWALLGFACSPPYRKKTDEYQVLLWLSQNLYSCTYQPKQGTGYTVPLTRTPLPQPQNCGFVPLRDNEMGMEHAYYASYHTRLCRSTLMGSGLFCMCPPKARFSY